ncbi:AAA family ATPase, partial [bacterium]|nr:AAA family ATPase [bacterium]
MFIKKLGIKNFRNYSDIEVEFNSKKILFIGKNAQGKTNLLESIYYLSTLDSLRAKT